MLISNVLRVVFVILVFGVLAINSAPEPKILKGVGSELDVIDIDQLDKIDDENDEIPAEEMDRIRRKVDEMSDEELAAVLLAVMPPEEQHLRTKRTIGTVRRCLEKVRCLFGNLRRPSRTRSKRQATPAAILRAISKLTSILSNMGEEIIGKGLGNQGISIGSLLKLFNRPPKANNPPTTTAQSDEDGLDDYSDSSTSASDDLDTGASVVTESTLRVCDQKCNLSVLVTRRIRRILKRL